MLFPVQMQPVLKPVPMAITRTGMKASATLATGTVGPAVENTAHSASPVIQGGTSKDMDV